jgi:ubiquinone/menaquinone biosynthesis C-methylase UbiE
MSRFDEKAADWDTPDRAARAHELAEAIRAHVPLDPTMRMVEIGAGTGLLGLDLLDDVASVLLTDPSMGMIEVARRKVRSGKIDGADAVLHDVLAGPPPGAPFDLAVSALVLHHIEDIEAALTSIRDMLNPGGWIAIADLEAEDGSFHDADAEGIHHHGFARDLLARAAVAAGFVDVAVHPAGTIDRNGEDYPVILLTGRR